MQNNGSSSPGILVSCIIIITIYSTVLKILKKKNTQIRKLMFVCTVKKYTLCAGLNPDCLFLITYQQLYLTILAINHM
jgi:hypothetical protein